MRTHLYSPEQEKKMQCEGFEYSWANPHRITLPEGPIHKSESALTLHHVLLHFKIFHEPFQLQAEWFWSLSWPISHASHVRAERSDHLLPVHSIKRNILPAFFACIRQWYLVRQRGHYVEPMTHLPAIFPTSSNKKNPPKMVNIELRRNQFPQVINTRHSALQGLYSLFLFTLLYARCWAVLQEPGWKSWMEWKLIIIQDNSRKFKTFRRNFLTSSSSRVTQSVDGSVAFILVEKVLNQQRIMHAPGFASRINFHCLCI